MYMHTYMYNIHIVSLSLYLEYHVHDKCVQSTPMRFAHFVIVTFLLSYLTCGSSQTIAPVDNDHYHKGPT